MLGRFASRDGDLLLVDLLHRFGANPKALTYDEVASTRNPLVLRWFEERGADLENGLPLAAALRSRNRAAIILVGFVANTCNEATARYGMELG